MRIRENIDRQREPITTTKMGERVREKVKERLRRESVRLRR